MKCARPGCIREAFNATYDGCCSLSCGLVMVGRADAFREAAEIARDEASNSLGARHDAALAILAAIEARAKEQP